MSEFDREPWIGDARRLLDESAQALDAATQSRLNRARQTALAGARRRVWPVAWFAAAGVACSAALLLAVALQRPPATAPSTAAQRVATTPPAAAARAVNPAGAAAAPRSSNAVPVVDADTPVADDSFDFYQDLDFYAWLDAQDGDGDG